MEISIRHDVYFHGDGSSSDILEALTRIEATLSEQSEALDRLEQRVTVDIDFLKAEAARLQALVDAAAALDPIQEAEIQALKDEAAAIVARMNEVDPLPDNPPVVPDPDPTPPPGE